MTCCLLISQQSHIFRDPTFPRLVEGVEADRAERAIEVFENREGPRCYVKAPSLSLGIPCSETEICPTCDS